MSEKLNTKLIQIERLFALGLFTNGFIHELSNPFNAILMNAELGLLYLEQSSDNAKQEKILRTIVQEAKRGGQTTHSVSNFIQADDYSPTERADLNEVISQGNRLLGSVLRRQNIELTIQPATKPVLMWLNPLALSLAIANLLRIAAGSEAKTIRLETVNRNDTAGLSITYDGVAIDKKTMTDGYKNDIAIVMQQPWGLELNLVKRIISDHQGHLEFNELSDKNIQLIVTLPVKS
jgi:signal transduction histidine kinase